MEPAVRSHAGAFVPGTCAVCGWRGIVGLVCRARRCAGRFFYDHNLGIVRAKGRVKVSKAQRSLFEDIRRWVSGAPVFQEVIFPWSIGPHGAGYRYDIAVPSLRLVVEYDSEMHFVYTKFFHKSMREFASMRLRDQIKDRMAKRAGWKLIRIQEGSPEGGLIVRKFIDSRRTVR